MGAEPWFVTPERMDDPLRPIRYRIFRDHAYEPSNVEARFLLERVQEAKRERDAAIGGKIDALAVLYGKSPALVAATCDGDLDPSGKLLGLVRDRAANSQAQPDD